MSSSYLALCQKLRQEVGVAGAGPATVVGQVGILKKLVDWVADADMHIKSKWLDWDFLWTQFSINTIANVKDYSAPSDIGLWEEESFYLNYSGDDPIYLKEMSYKAWRTAYPNSETGTPSYYVIKPDKNIILYSTPDGIDTLTADYWRTPVKLAANTDTSLIPAKFDRLIIAQAKIFYAEHENAPEVMQAAINEYTTLLHRLESAYLPGQDNAFTKSTDSNMVTRPE